MNFLKSEDCDKGHGRIEVRKCVVTDQIDWLKLRHSHWKGLKSVIEITSLRDIQNKQTTEKRYYISSLPPQSDLLKVVREHWGVENGLHWVLDVSFNDDQCRIRKGNAPRNIAIIKKTALNLLRFIKKQRPRVSLKAMRKMAGWDNNFLDSVLLADF